MILGVAIAVVYLLGHSSAAGATTLRPDQLTLFGAMSPRESLALFLPTLFLLLGEANMYQKFFSARDERAARLAVIGWIVGTILVETLIVAIGVLGSARIAGLGVTESETIVIRVAKDILPTMLGTILLCGAAAIIVSTANSMLLTPATSLVHDVYRRFVSPSVTDREILIYTRGAVVALGAVAFIIGNFFPTILSMALWAYTMYGAAITPALLAAFLWPRVTRAGSVASITAGMVTTLGWEMYARYAGGYPYELATVYPALTLSLLALVGVSLATPPPTREELAVIS
jgi:Na+/proline symporter